MLEKGTMQPIKKILGTILLVAGIGLIVMPDKTANILCKYKLIFGVIVSIAGYFSLISGRRQ